jgi:hypothetical protein
MMPSGMEPLRRLWDRFNMVRLARSERFIGIRTKIFVVLEMELSEAAREAVDNRWDHSSDLVPSDAELLQICAVCQGRKERLEVGVVLWTL